MSDSDGFALNKRNRSAIAEFLNLTYVYVLAHKPRIIIKSFNFINMHTNSIKTVRMYCHGWGVLISPVLRKDDCDFRLSSYKCDLMKLTSNTEMKRVRSKTAVLLSVGWMLVVFVLFCAYNIASSSHQLAAVRH